eukprot:scaffold6391_cov114-Isochrysis_galbana.AAC.2
MPALACPLRASTPGPLSRVDGEHAVKQVDGGGREIGTAALVPAEDGACGRIALLLCCLEEREAPVARVRLGEREEAGQHCKQADAERPDVGLEAVVAFAREHLRRHVRLGPDQPRQPLAAVELTVCIARVNV